MTTGYGIYSGGLDSMLSARVLMDQGIGVVLLTYATPFFGPEKALESGKIVGIQPRVLDLTEAHLHVLKNPKHGYGRYMNPCIDCHALMFRRAAEIMMEEGGDFVFSGEVLGQRPMSQNRQALDLVARESGVGDYILRPLSAKALPETRMEQDGLVVREQLLGLTGRSRKPQMELAARYGWRDYPTPAGGCLLTDPVFSRRLKELTGPGWAVDLREMEMLKWGRQFRLPGGAKLVVGRNQRENEALENLVRPDDIIFRVEGVPGPMVMLVHGGSADWDQAAMIAVSYSDAPDFETCPVRIFGGGADTIIQTEGRPKHEFADLMI